MPLFTTSLHYVDDIQPTITQHGDWENPDERIEFPFAATPGLTLAIQERLKRLAGEQMDEGRCEAEGCATMIGFVLHEDEDHPAVGWQWHWVTAIETVTGKVVLVCEECAPSNFYNLED